MIYIVSLPLEEMRKYTPTTMPQPTDQQLSDFYVRLGMAMAAWQFIESVLVYLFSRALGSSATDPVAAAFHTPTNFRTRLDMTNEAMKRSLATPDLRTEWSKLYDRAVEKGKRRNRLAHSVVFFDPQHKKANRQLFISPSFGDPTRFDSKFSPKAIITQSQLDDMINMFNQLYDDLAGFHVKLLHLPPPSTSSPRPEA